MWGKTKIDEEEAAKTASSRLITVLGLDHSDLRDGASPPAPSSISEPINPAGKTSGSSIYAMLERLSRREGGSDRAVVTPSGPKAEDDTSFLQTNRASATMCVENEPLRTSEAHLPAVSVATEPTLNSERLVEKSVRQFEATMTRQEVKTVSQVDATMRPTASLLENFVADDHEMEMTMDENLANLARKMTEAAHGQINTLEESLAKVAERVSSRIQTEFEPIAKRVESYRAQAEEMNSTLESALARFTQRAEDAAKAQAWLFDEKIARVSEQAVSHAQENVQNGITQLRETATHSFEEQIAALGESLERRLKETFEAWSKTQLEMAQQQASKFSSDLLSQVRTESENIVQYLHTRLKSDAQVLETKTFDAMQSKLQKATEEFRSVLERTLA
jgi:hypothetical protein